MTDQTTEQTADQPSALAASPGRGARRGPAWLAVALAVLSGLLVAALVVVLLVPGLRAGGESDPKQVQVALDTARQDAVKLFSFDYRHLDSDFAQSKELTTGPFASEYAKSAAAAKDTAKRYQAVVTAGVPDGNAGVVAVDGERVDVLLLIDQLTRSTLAKDPKISTNKVRMVMLRVHGTWKVERVTGPGGTS